MNRKTRVVNLRHDPYDVYVGRAGHGQEGTFGNPYRIGFNCTREECLKLFETYFRSRVENDMEFRALVKALKGKTLGCFCVREPYIAGEGGPLVCHGQIVADWVEENA